jgi:hypothetical protein
LYVKVLQALHVHAEYIANSPVGVHSLPQSTHRYMHDTKTSAPSRRKRPKHTHHVPTQLIACLHPVAAILCELVGFLECAVLRCVSVAFNQIAQWPQHLVPRFRPSVSSTTLAFLRDSYRFPRGLVVTPTHDSADSRLTPVVLLRNCIDSSQFIPFVYALRHTIRVVRLLACTLDDLDIQLLASCTSLHVIDLSGCDGFQTVALLGELPYLHTLRLDNCHSVWPDTVVTALNSACRRGSKSIATPPCIRHLSLNGLANLTCLPALGALPLRSLSVSHTSLSFDAFAALGVLSELRHLDVRGCALSSTQLDALKVPRFCTIQTDASFARICRTRHA